MQLNKPSPRLAILRAQLAAKAEAEQLQRDTMRLMSLAPIRCKAPAPDAATLPLPPSYWDDLEHWLKTLAPAKPAREYGEPQKAIPSHAVSHRPCDPPLGNLADLHAADVWHSEAPSVAGVYVTRWAGFHHTNRHWDGSLWSQGHADANRDTDRQGESCRYAGSVEWLRLIEADAPATRLASTSSADGAALVGSK